MGYHPVYNVTAVGLARMHPASYHHHKWLFLLRFLLLSVLACDGQEGDFNPTEGMAQLGEMQEWTAAKSIQKLHQIGVGIWNGVADLVLLHIGCEMVLELQ